MTTKKRWQYPTPVSGAKGFVFSLAFGLFISFFLWFFEPFDINVKPYVATEILCFGLITFGIFCFAHSILPMIFPSIYRESRWTVYSQIIFYLILLFAIATLNGLYINYITKLNFSWSNYLLIIVQTFAVGIIPIALYVLISHNLMYRKIAAQSSLLDQQLHQLQGPQSEQYNIQSKAKGESLVLSEDSFRYAKSSGNYIEVFTVDQAPKIYRMGLSDLDKQLASNPYLIRCHRSYFVNLKQVAKVTGNAQGLKLWMLGEELAVPVSRKYLEAVRSGVAKK
ncbi:MAG: LytTR family DNA-binding domain-containing protein [Bacteroidota bacterium]